MLGAGSIKECVVEIYRAHLYKRALKVWQEKQSLIEVLKIIAEK